MLVKMERASEAEEIMSAVMQRGSILKHV